MDCGFDQLPVSGLQVPIELIAEVHVRVGRDFLRRPQIGRQPIARLQAMYGKISRVASAEHP